jgi:hypothetical protein
MYVSLYTVHLCVSHFITLDPSGMLEIDFVVYWAHI